MAARVPSLSSAGAGGLGAVPARRHLLRSGAALVVAGSAGTPVLARVVPTRSDAPLAPTPAMTEGPFYPPTLPSAPVRTLRIGTAAPAGRPMHLVGRVVDTAGRPLDGARIEIWQCDGRGHYHHPGDDGVDDRDPDFSGFGWQPTSADGEYAFETIEPVPYPGRSPHVHVRVRQGARIRLTSQVFLPERVDENGRDFLWRSLGGARQRLVAGTDAAGPGPRRLRFDIVVG